MPPPRDLRLARDNAHSRDSRISFDEDAHVYTVDGRVVIGSVSSLWGAYFSSFDAPAVARKCYPKWAVKARDGEDAETWTYTERFVRLIECGDDAAVVAAGVTEPVCATDKGYSCLLKYFWSKDWGSNVCIDNIVKLWSKLGEAASARGTYVHLQCELHCNDELYDTAAPEVRQYLKFRADHPNLTPYRTEWSVFSRLGLYVVAGQIDGIYVDPEGEYFMIDYKCCASALTPANPFRKFGKFPFDEVPDNSYGHYAAGPVRLHFETSFTMI